MTSPPKHQSDSNKLVNRLGLATLSLRPRWRVMVLGHQSVGKSGTLHLNIYPVIINGIDATTQCLNLDRPDPLKSIHERDRTTRLVQYSFALLGTFKMNKGWSWGWYKGSIIRITDLDLYTVHWPCIYHCESRPDNSADMLLILPLRDCVAEAGETSSSRKWLG